VYLKVCNLFLNLIRLIDMIRYESVVLAVTHYIFFLLKISSTIDLLV